MTRAPAATATADARRGSAGIAGRLLLSVALALGLAFALAPPVTFPLGATLYNMNDQVGHAWHYGHLAQALAGSGPLFSSTDIYFPEGADHLLHRGGHLLVFLSWPVVALTENPVLAHNLLVLLALATTCAAGALLASAFSPTLPAMVLGAVALGLNRALYEQLLNGQTEEVLVGLVAVALLALDRAVDLGGRRRALAAGGAMGLAFHANMEFGIFIAFYVFARVVLMGRDLLDPRRLRRLLGAGLVAATLAAPLVVAYVARQPPAEAHAALVEARQAVQAGLRREYSVSLASLANAGTTGDRRHRPSLALVGLALVGLAAGDRNMRRRWGLPAGACLLFSFGPVLRLVDPVLVRGAEVPMPFALVGQWIPFLSRLHFPSRFLMAAHVGAVALAAGGVAALRARWPGRPVGVALLGVALLAGVEQVQGTHLPHEVPAPGPVREATRFLAEAGSEPFAVIDLPSFGHERPPVNHVFYLQRRFHGRPTLDGMGSLFLEPPTLQAFRMENPFLHGLQRLQAPRDLLALGAGLEARPVRREDLEVLGAMGFRYVVAWPDRLLPQLVAPAVAWLEGQLGPPRRVGGQLLFSIPTPDGTPARITAPEDARRRLRAYLAEPGPRAGS